MESKKFNKELKEINKKQNKDNLFFNITEEEVLRRIKEKGLKQNKEAREKAREDKNLYAENLFK